MDTPLLTIAEAAEKIGRSHSTIRRLIRTIADSPSHPDRGGIEPTPKAVETFKKKGENFTWMVREDVLMKHLQSAPQEEKKSSSGSSSDVKQDVLDILRKELAIKNQQIEKQWEVISSLNERLREGNILMGSLQQKLSLPEPQSPSPVTVDAASPSERIPSMEPSKETMRASRKKVAEAKEKVSMKASKVASTKEPVTASGMAAKKGIIGWLFR